MDALHILAGVGDLGVAGAVQILQIVDEGIACAAADKPDLGRVLAVGEVIFADHDLQDLRVVDGRSGNLVRIGAGGGGHVQGIGQGVAVHIDDLGLEVHALAGIVQIIIGGGDGVDLEGVILGNDAHALRDRGANGDGGAVSLINPAGEDAVGREGRLREGSDDGTVRVEVLDKDVICIHAAVRGTDDKGDGELVCKVSAQLQVGDNRLAAGVGAAVHRPAAEGLAADHRGRRHGEGVTGVAGVLLIGLAFHQEGDMEDLLVVNRPNIGTAMDGDKIRKQAAAVGPAAREARAGGHIRDVVKAVVGVGIDGAGLEHFGTRKIRTGPEGDGVGDGIVVRDDSDIFRRNKVFINAVDGRPDGALAAGGGGADCPVSDIIVARNRCGKRAYGLLLLNGNDADDLIVAVKEGDVPVLGLLVLFVFVFFLILEVGVFEFLILRVFVLEAVFTEFLILKVVAGIRIRIGIGAGFSGALPFFKGQAVLIRGSGADGKRGLGIGSAGITAGGFLAAGCHLPVRSTFAPVGRRGFLRDFFDYDGLRFGNINLVLYGEVHLIRFKAEVLGFGRTGGFHSCADIFVLESRGAQDAVGRPVKGKGHDDRERKEQCRHPLDYFFGFVTHLLCSPLPFPRGRGGFPLSVFLLRCGIGNAGRGTRSPAARCPEPGPHPTAETAARKPARS